MAIKGVDAMGARGMGRRKKHNDWKKESLASFMFFFAKANSSVIRLKWMKCCWVILLFLRLEASLMHEMYGMVVW